MNTLKRKHQQHHATSTKGSMGLAALATSGIFFVLHLLFPATALWPGYFITLGIVLSVVSHRKKQLNTQDL